MKIPAEFQYWQNKDSLKARVSRRLLHAAFGVDPVLPEETVLQYAQSYYDADPVAEDFVAEVYMKQGQKAGRAMIDQALEHGVSSVKKAPKSLQTLFAEMEKDPDWLDWELVEQGARVFRRFGTHMYSFAGAITLEGYRENSVAKPLAFTGTYTGATANKRFLETAAFWIDVSGPGALRPGGQGVKTALRVRLMHVFVRKRLMEHPKWKLEEWGVPISQGDALLTLMGGSFIPGYGLRMLGYRTSRQEIEAMMHFWRYVGHLMGVQPRWYPSNIAEAVGLMYTSQVKGVERSGDDGTNLAQSYIASYEPTEKDKLTERISKRFEYGLQLGYMSWWIPPWTYRHYKLPKPGIWRWHLAAQFPLVFGVETLRKRSARIDDLVDKRARRKARSWVDMRLGERKTEYAAVENFTR